MDLYTKLDIKEINKMTVTYKEYMGMQRTFFEKHNYDFRIETSPMDEYGRYVKIYNFEDGAQWFEQMSPEYVKETVKIKLAQAEVEVKMLRTEFWSTESSSNYYYEKF